MRQLASALLLLCAARTASAQIDAPRIQEEPPPKPEPLGAPERPYARADAGKDTVRFALNFYEQSDGGGNPNLDERMRIVEPMVLVNRSLGEKWTGSLRLQGDIITAASNDGATGNASGTFVGGEASLFYAWAETTKVGAGVSYSDEPDYVSRGAWLKVSHETPGRMDAFSLRVGMTSDELGVTLFDGTSLGSDTRQAFAFSLGWTRVLGPRTIGSLHYDFTSQDGHLGTPGNSVLLGAGEFPEDLPRSRTRHSFFARVRHLLTDDLAIEPGAGFYLDDWGATAFHFELAAYWEAVPDALIVRPAYRFHSQSAVDAWVEEGSVTLPEFRTQDADLGTFTSHSFGLRFILPEVRMLGGAELEFGGDVTLRSDGLDSFSFTVGCKWGF